MSLKKFKKLKKKFNFNNIDNFLIMVNAQPLVFHAYDNI